jgi:hypothetical protein
LPWTRCDQREMQRRPSTLLIWASSRFTPLPSKDLRPGEGVTGTETQRRRSTLPRAREQCFNFFLSVQLASCQGSSGHACGQSRLPLRVTAQLPLQATRAVSVARTKLISFGHGL